MGKEKKQKIEITEMFVAKACPARVFWGIITRTVADDGTPILFSRILMDDDGLLCASAENQKVLSKHLNELAKMVCIGNLHSDSGVTKEIFGNALFLN